MWESLAVSRYGVGASTSHGVTLVIFKGLICSGRHCRDLVAAAISFSRARHQMTRLRAAIYPPSNSLPKEGGRIGEVGGYWRAVVVVIGEPPNISIAEVTYMAESYA